MEGQSIAYWTLAMKQRGVTEADEIWAAFELGQPEFAPAVKAEAQERFQLPRGFPGR